MKIWIATGGTGGHVFPAMAAATELASRGHKITISCDGRTDKWCVILCMGGRMLFIFGHRVLVQKVA